MKKDQLKKFRFYSNYFRTDFGASLIYIVGILSGLIIF